MSMMVNISCDEAGCDAYAEEPVGMDDGANAIESQLEPGWSHDSGEDFCPKHAE
tara:strand:- start:26600 stop:26761 length:162 start_codon:yes stop_codon:yes gene_type:complete